MPSNLCRQCHKRKKRHGSRCDICYWRRKAGDHLKTPGQWRAIKALWEAQGRRCAYSGRLVKPGKNLSIDHLRPRGLFPGEAVSLNNLFIVDTEVNIAKSHLSLDDFLKLCKSVVDWMSQQDD
jgi:hypothetical protein